MKSGNKILDGFWLVLLVTGFLFLLKLIPSDTKLFGLQLKPVDIISDLTESDDYDYSDYKFQDDNEKSDTTNKLINQNFFDKQELNQAAFFYFGENDKSASISDITRKVKISGNIAQMKYFFDALKQTGSTKVRIAHFGDSGIEGDLITAQLREKLQNSFGGKGVGFLSITSQDVKFRTTTQMDFSSNWETASIFTSNPKKYPLGVNGEVFIAKPNSYVEYTATPRKFKNIKTFSTVRLFYSDADNSPVNYSFDDGTKETANLSPSSSVKELVLDAKKSVKKVRLEFPNTKKGYFYGVSLEEGNGIYVDNFPLRGNSGASIKDIPIEKLKDFNKLLNYKLIILQFGLNVANQRQRDFVWYEKEMASVISHLKSAFPNTSILLVSVSDKSVKKGSNFVTDPGVISLLEAQRRIAETNGVAFWNLFEAMGGPNSMPKWVDSNPPKAFKDYTHFNLDGAADIAELLGEALLDAAKK
jgi:lysophospholipase L1-like esterase